MAGNDIDVLAGKLRAYWLRDFGASVNAATSTGGGTGMSAHALSGPFHTGELAPIQAPWAVTDAELAAHAADPDVHHPRQHNLATTSGLGADHYVTGLTYGQVLMANGADQALFGFLNHTSLANVLPDQHHAQVHNVVGTDHTLTGAKWSTVGATATNTIGLMTPASDVTGATKEALLKSDSAGWLALVRLWLTERLTTPLVTAPSHLTLQPTDDLILNPGTTLTKMQNGGAFQSHNYVSQLTGMRVTDLGEGDFRYLFADEMHVKSFIADLEQALAGGQIISKSVAPLGLNFYAPGTTGSTVTYRAHTTTTSAGPTITGSKPTGTVELDFMLAHLTHITANTVTTIPDGWTLLGTVSDAFNTTSKVYYRVAGASEPSTYAWTLSSTGEYMLTITSYSGVNPAAPINVWNASFTGTNSIINTPVVTTTVTNVKFAWFASSINIGAGTVTAVPSSGLTERADYQAGVNSWAYYGEASQAAAGASITYYADWTGARPGTAWIIALAPAQAGVTTLVVKDFPSASNMAVFQNGDVVLLRKFSRTAGTLTVANCWGTVTGYTDGSGVNGIPEGMQQWTFTRSAAPNAGTMTAGTVVEKDTLVLDFGVSGNGYYEVNTIDGLWGLNSPYLQFVRWTTHPATGSAIRLRAGQLRGIFNQDEFGFFAGTGSANTDRYLRLSDYAAGNGINNLPFRLRNAGTTVVEFADWNNIWIGPNSADKRLSWDGNTLQIVGQIAITGGTGYTALTDRPTSLSAINSSEGTKLGGIQAGATVGATWGTNIGNQPTSLSGINSAEGTKLSGIQAGATVGATWNVNMIPPARFGDDDTPAASGLYMTANYMGYWNAGLGQWKTFMDSLGNFYFGGSTGASIRWNGTVLAGYDSVNTAHWSASSTDGRLYAGHGNVKLDYDGLTLVSANPEVNELAGRVKWRAPGYSTGPEIYGTSTGVVFETYGWGGSNPLRLRTSSGAYNVWHELNHGPGSGLHADLLDGYHASSFALLSGAAFSGSISAASITGSSLSINSGGAWTGAFSAPSNANNYGYLDYNYAGARSGYALFSASELSFRADGGRYLTLHGARIGINRTDPGYVFDVSGEARVTGSMRLDVALSLGPNYSPPGASAVYFVLYYDGNDGLLKYRTTSGLGGQIRKLSYTL